MRHTSTALHRSQQLLHTTEQLQEKAAVLLAQSRVLLACGKARASPTDEATDDLPLLAPAQGHAAPSERPLTYKG
jgi:hypothetical protein